MPKRYFAILFLTAVALGLLLRLPQLSLRPMHTDEAVHAVKFGELLEDNEYRYDPWEYHGPTLNYFSLAAVVLQGKTNINEVTETDLRLVTVLFGAGVILTLLLYKKELGGTAIVGAAFFTALSPSMVFYSRYYIMEILAVFFTFFLLYTVHRMLTTPSLIWAVLAGATAGLMHATKETCIIAWGSIGTAVIVTSLLNRNHDQNGFDYKKVFGPAYIAGFLISAAALSILFFSSFFSNWQGVADSVLTYQTYFERAGQKDVHIYPWWYYLRIIGFYNIGEGSVWTEAIAFFFALAASWFAFAKRLPAGIDRKLLQVLTLFTWSTFIIYSAIPYKTPWNMLTFHQGILLLAGAGAAIIWYRAENKRQRYILIAVFLLTAVSHGWQAYDANFTQQTDPTNPYVYSHPGSDLFRMVEKTGQAAAASEAGDSLYIQVIDPAGEYWPLPWYLRKYDRIGYWQQVDYRIPAAPLIIARAELESDIMHLVYEIPPPGEKSLYMPFFDEYREIRPGVEYRGYIRKDLWDRMQLLPDPEPFIGDEDE